MKKGLKVSLIVLIAGLMLLSMVTSPAMARPTVVNISYSSQVGGMEDMTLTLHAFGFPDEELEWHGKLVIPESSDLPSGTSTLTIYTDIYHTIVGSSHVTTCGFILDSTNPDVVGATFELDVHENYINLRFMGPGLTFNLMDLTWGGTQVIIKADPGQVW